MKQPVVDDVVQERFFMSTQLAVQLYTLREYTKTPKEIDQTFKKVKSMGYDAVQCSALGPIDPKELAKLLKDNGLICCATHGGLDRMRDQTQAVIEEHHLWGCKYTAIGGFFPKAEDYSEALWTKFVADFNAVAAKFDGSGVKIGYHNHSHEFAKVGSKTAWQILMDGFNPHVWVEVDTYWVQHGGGDPAHWIEANKGRIPCVHLKDMGIKPGTGHYMMEVGQGNLNWDRVLQACRNVGVEWYIVEQDTCYRDPFESLKISLDFLKARGFK